MRLVVFFVLSLLCINSSNAKNSNSSISLKIDTLANRFFTDKKPGGVILAAKDGNVIYRKAFGKANLELGVDTHVNHVFGIASNTKPFTAVAVLKLVEQGRLKLNDDIKMFLPDFPTHGQSITIEHLLTHTSGIHNYNDNFSEYSKIEMKHHNNQQMLEVFKDKPLNFNPGEKFRYNNSAYFLLGLIIEQITNKTYQAYLRDEIFTKLNMKNTHFNAPQEVIHNRVSGYETRGNGFIKSRPVSLNFSTSPAGGIASTVDDMHKFYQALSEYKILSKESVNSAFKVFKLNNGQNSRTGYGWFVGNLLGASFVGHDGRSWGFVSSMVFIPEEKIFVVVLTNSSWYGYGSSVAYFPHKIAAIMLNKPYGKLAESSAKKFKKYAGKYKSENGNVKVIDYENGQLFLNHHGHRSEIYYAAGQNEFYIEDTFETLSFKHGRDGIFLKSIIGSPEEFIKL